MKPLLFSLFSFIPLLSVGQYNDTIVTKAGEQIICQITLVNNANIFYKHKPKNSEKTEHIAIGEVASCTYELPEITKKDVVRQIDDKTGKITYKEVVDVDSTLTGTSLYLKGKEWVALSFKSANDVIQLDDKENGKIIGKGALKINSNCTVCGASGIHTTQAGYVEFTFKLRFKDGRYRYEFTDFVHNAKYSGGALEREKGSCGGMYMTKKAWASIKYQFNEKMTATIASLKNSILTQVEMDDDW